MSWGEIGLALTVQAGLMSLYMWGLWRMHKRGVDHADNECEEDSGWLAPAINTSVRARSANAPDFPPDLFVRLYQAENGVMLELQSSTPQQGAYTRSLTLFTGEDISKIGEVVQTKLVVQRMTGGK